MTSRPKVDRRRFLMRSAGAAVAPLIGALPAAAATAKVSLRLRPDTVLREIAPDFIGLGYETSSVAVPGLLSAKNKVYVQLLRNLGPRGVVRIGGNTSDYARFAPSGKSQSSPTGTVVTRANLRQLRGFLDATGWNVIWGLNLGDGGMAMAVAEAAAVAAIMGDRLIALQIGNEPDLFHPAHRPATWSYDAYLAGYRQYKAAIRERLPHVRFAGPDVAGATAWAQDFAKDEGRDLALLTHHYYLADSAAASSTVAKLLTDDPRLPALLRRLETAATGAHLPYRLCEANSLYGGGKAGVSDTFASALWALDFMFALVSQNCAGVNFETGVNHLGFISHYTPIADDQKGHFPVAPEYYGLLTFARAAQGRQIALESHAGGINVKTYATARADGEIVLTVINKDENHNASVTAVCDNTLREAAALRLTAPAEGALKDVRLGGSMVDDNGRWDGGKMKPIRITGEQIAFDVPAASAALIILKRG